ncbi:unnamed protein product [Strongylus vulgaris]|uniref:Uncharacterized protein n=1 Tax=Strongylus vulgaris TaxID=40348 RepID=A0A3P7JRN6_STRVU|nr:unnamed protein product [Strongylus vulgaris]
MSYTESENYHTLYEKDRRSCDANRQEKRRRKLLDKDIFVTKTLCDPANVLSKRCKKKLLAEKFDGFSPNVPYSLNKQKRWSTITATSLLKNQQENSPETVIVHRTDVPLKESGRVNSIQNVEIVENDAIKKLSGGRRKALKYFNGQIRQLRHMDKKEVEPARIHFNFTKQTSPILTSGKKSKRTTRRKGMFEKFGSADFGEFECSDIVEVTDEEADPEKKENKRATELADYLTLSDKGVQTTYTHNQHHSEAKTFSVISEDSTSKKILSSVPDRYIVTWFGSKRVLVRSRPYSKPMFALFFEHEEERKILRVRVNTNSQYVERARSSHFKNVIRQRSYNSLFLDLEEFIIKTGKEESKDPGKDSRFSLYPECFEHKFHSEFIAPLATKFNDQDQIEYLSRPYIQDSRDIASFEVIGHGSLVAAHVRAVDVLSAICATVNLIGQWIVNSTNAGLTDGTFNIFSSKITCLAMAKCDCALLVKKYFRCPEDLQVPDVLVGGVDGTTTKMVDIITAMDTRGH